MPNPIVSHEEYDRYFEPATAVQAEGARVGLATCSICGANVLLDPREKINYLRVHINWHRAIDPDQP